MHGNNRVSFTATAIFLKINGLNLQIGADEAESFLIDKVIRDRVKIDDIAAWLEPNIKVQSRS